MSTRVRVAGVWLAGTTLLSCGPQSGEEGLREILERDRRAHLETDALLLTRGMADTVWNLDGGLMRPTTRGELEAEFTAYFEGARYRAWEDLQPPVVRISDDGSMAWVARRVFVDREGPAFGGGTRRERFESAWTATYGSVDGEWQMTSVASTFVEIPSASLVLAGARRATLGDADPSSRAFVRYHAEASSPDGPYEVTYAAATDLSARIDFSLGMSAGISREGGWMVAEPGTAPTPLSDTLETFLRGHDLLMNVLAPERRFGPIRFAGLEPFTGQSAIRIDGRDALGAPIQLYYAESDTLPLGYRLIDHLRGGGPVITTLTDWRAQDGALWPRAARFAQDGDVFDYRIVTIETAEEAGTGVFDPPGEEGS